MRLDSAEKLGPVHVVKTLRSHGVSDLFLLYPLPSNPADQEFVKNLRSNMTGQISLHLWIPVFRNERYFKSHPSEGFASSPRKVESGWINPTSERYEDKFLGWVKEALDRIKPDGIFLDYFYVPYGPFDNETISRFCSERGINTTYEDLVQNPRLLSDFISWRNNKMIKLLSGVRDLTREERKKLSVFALMFEPSARVAMGQDLSRFSNLVDFLVSDTYHIAAKRDAAWVGQGVHALRSSGTISVWAGIQGYDIPPREIGRAIRSALDAGAEGIVVFRYGTLTDEDWRIIRQSVSKHLGYLWLAIPLLVVIGVYIALRRMGSSQPDRGKPKPKDRRRPRRKR